MIKRILLVLTTVLLIDQLTKIWVKLTFTIGERIVLIPGFFELHFIENTGMAFGMEIPGSWGKIALSLFRIVAVVVITLYLKRLIKDGAHKGFITCVALILAGALGNIIDSALYGIIFSRSSFGQLAEFMPADGGYASFLRGNVVDMLHFTVKWPEWVPWGNGNAGEIFPPIFNVADSAITVGVIWILIRQKLYFARHEETHADEQAEDSSVVDSSEA